MNASNSISYASSRNWRIKLATVRSSLHVRPRNPIQVRYQTALRPARPPCSQGCPRLASASLLRVASEEARSTPRWVCKGMGQGSALPSSDDPAKNDYDKAGQGDPSELG